MTDRLPSRRELLIGWRRSPSTEDEDSQVAIDPKSIREQRQSEYIEHYSKKAMACQFETVFNVGQYEQAAEATLNAFELVDRLETQMTVYQEWSELSRINQSAHEGWVAVESNLYRLLKRAQTLWELTEGAFDVTSTPLSRVWGFTRRAGRIPSTQELDEARSKIGMQCVEFDDDSNQIRFQRIGIELNLGGIGKGYALDRLIESLTRDGIANVLTHAGQSSLAARGCRTGIERHGRVGWSVGLCHPIWPEKRIAEIQLVDQALGTAGTSRQSFYHQGKRYGHIIDPRTGMPADVTLSATVIAPSAEDADALATACYVTGEVGALSLSEKRPDLGIILCLPSNTRGDVRFITFGIDPEHLRVDTEQGFILKRELQDDENDGDTPG